jgi:hypothetical protein
MIMIALWMTAPDLHRLASEAARIDQLVQQLGNDAFAEREAATKSLHRLVVYHTTDLGKSALSISGIMAATNDICRHKVEIAQPPVTCVTDH